MMNSNRMPPQALRASVLAVQAALALLGYAGLAHAAEDPTVEELVRPRSTIEVGGIYVDEDSYKAGEYNGLHDKGFHANVGFDLRGGAAHDSGGTDRWRVFGSKLGLDVRNLGVEVGSQGGFRLRAEYDELRRNYADNYLTLWRGAGTTTLSLPAEYPPPGAARTAAYGNTQTNPVLLGLMRNYDLSTTRKRTALAGELALTRQWSVSLNARNEKKQGAKLTGVNMGGMAAGAALVPEPIDSDTNIVEAAVRYATRNAHFRVGYNVSLYRNRVDEWTVQTPFRTAILNNQSMMNGAPDNEMHQLVVDGGYKFSPTTKLVLAGAYTRMTQDEAFHYQAGPGWNVNGGATSSNSKEIKKDLLARLTTTPLTGLDLSAAYKYEDRDNQSPVGLYIYSPYDGTGTAASRFRNAPIDREQHQLSLDARYALSQGQWVSAGLEHVKIERSADPSIDPTTLTQNEPWASSGSKENTLKLGYRQELSPAVTGQVSYARSQRRADDYEEPGIAPLTSSTNRGYYAAVPGFRQFYLADRNRDKLRGALDFQLSEAFLLQAGIEYLNDKYPSQYGLTKSDSKVFNLDASYSASDRLSFNGFVTLEDMKSEQNHHAIPAVGRGGTGVVPTVAHNPDGTCATYLGGGLPTDYLTDPCRNWSVTQSDKVWTVGAGFKSSQWMGGKLTLGADVVYSRARTNIDFTGGTYYGAGGTGATARNLYIPAQNMPAITTTTTDFKLSALYALDKNSAIKAGWLHRRMKAYDPLYDNYGITSVQSIIGPGLASPKYHQNAVSVSYVYTFR